MVFIDFSFLRERQNPALVPVSKKLPCSPVVSLEINPVTDSWDVTDVPRSSALVASMPMQQPMSEPQPRSLRLRNGPRSKSYSEGVLLEKPAHVPKKARPYSAGDMDDIRRVAISGFSKNKNGTWIFKVNVGTDEFDTYAIRRRFSDFKELHDMLQDFAYPEQLPELPHHGIFSVMQMFFSPEPALCHRAKKLEGLLQYVNKHPLLSTSMAFSNFLGKNPTSRDVGYVSLSCYEAPDSDSGFRLSTSSSRSRGQLS